MNRLKHQVATDLPHKSKHEGSSIYPTSVGEPQSLTKNHTVFPWPYILHPVMSSKESLRSPSYPQSPSFLSLPHNFLPSKYVSLSGQFICSTLSSPGSVHLQIYENFLLKNSFNKTVFLTHQLTACGTRVKLLVFVRFYNHSHPPGRFPLSHCI
jgi:hypothetical protein